MASSDWAGGTRWTLGTTHHALRFKLSSSIICRTLPLRPIRPSSYNENPNKLETKKQTGNIGHLLFIYITYMELRSLRGKQSPGSTTSPLTHSNKLFISSRISSKTRLLVDPGRMCRRSRKSRDSTNFIVPGKAGGSRRQRRKVSKFCTREAELIHQATKGARIATLECEHQFKSRHWNCSALPRSIRKILAKGTKELSRQKKFNFLCSLWQVSHKTWAFESFWTILVPANAREGSRISVSSSNPKTLSLNQIY